MSQEQPEKENGKDVDAEPLFPQSGANREEMTENYLPGEDQWAAKTHLNLEDPATLAALSQMGKMYPEVDGLQDIIDGALETYLPAKTSVGGRSRQEYKEIFESMFGGKSSDKKNTALQLVSADED